MSETDQYYIDKAQEFFDSTVEADVRPLFEHFCKFVPSGGRVLDFGCGSGRDVKAFLDMGYQAEGIDGSPELCKLAGEFAGVEIRCLDFSEFDVQNTYDGIWACASLLHVPFDELATLIMKMRAALKENGIMYMSFKYGDHEGLRDERYFTDMTEDRFAALFGVLQGLKIEEQWYSEDVRRGKEVHWFNVILRRV